METDKAHILVVDDDTRLRSLLQRFLRENDFYVSVAKDAAEARERLSEYKFDLLIVDIMMPEETGLEFLEKLRRESSVPVIMLTAMGLGAAVYLLALSPLMRPLWDFWLSAAAGTGRLLWWPVKKITAAAKKVFIFCRKCVMIRKKRAAEKEAERHAESADARKEAPDKSHIAAGHSRAGGVFRRGADPGGQAAERGRAAAGRAGETAAAADPGEPGAGV